MCIKEFPNLVYDLKREISKLHSEKATRETHLNSKMYSLSMTQYTSQMTEIELLGNKINELQNYEPHLMFKSTNVNCQRCSSFDFCMTKCEKAQ